MEFHEIVNKYKIIAEAAVRIENTMFSMDLFEDIKYIEIFENIIKDDGFFLFQTPTSFEGDVQAIVSEFYKKVLIFTNNHLLFEKTF